MNSTGDGWTSSVPVDGDFPKGLVLGYEDKPEKAELVVCVSAPRPPRPARSATWRPTASR